MSESIEELQHKIRTAGELHSVVRTMKALAATSIGQYERAVQALQDYYRSVELGLSACIRQLSEGAPDGSLLMAASNPVGMGEEATGAGRRSGPGRNPAAGIIVFGSDQGLVGQFNASLVDFCSGKMRAMPGEKAIYAVGERIWSEWEGIGIGPAGRYDVPISINGITPLANRLLIEIERQRGWGRIGDVYVFHNKPVGQAGYEPVIQRLLPLAKAWEEELSGISWPAKQRPEVIGGSAAAGYALIREYLFVSLYKSCAESLAAENASRLAAMQHAEKNIEQLSDELISGYHRLRQQEIDEDLFDIISGSEAVIGSR